MAESGEGVVRVKVNTHQGAMLFVYRVYNDNSECQVVKTVL